MKKVLLATSLLILIGIGLLAITSIPNTSSVLQRNEVVVRRLIPASHSKEVPPDTHLTIEFNSSVQFNQRGMIRIFDAETKQLVDSLDLSIPAGPTSPDMIRKQKATYSSVPYDYDSHGKHITNLNTHSGTPSGIALQDTTGPYQLSIIGRFSDGFHFYPIIINGCQATIYPHHNMLEYGKSYYVTIDKEVFDLSMGEFTGIYDNQSWCFSTRSHTPETGRRILSVNCDGSGDFCTVQGAMDFIPEFSNEKWTVLIANGDYEELVYFRNKQNVLLRGENRDSVLIHYANNETFNPHPINVKTNEKPGTFPSRRAAFAADNCYDMRFENLTIQNDSQGQAEGLLLMGARNYLRNVRIIGAGDALQINGSVYFEHCIVNGGGDMILGRGPAFFQTCTLQGPGPFMWVRNTEANHGNIFVNCSFIGSHPHSVLARSPLNRQPDGYPYAEAVLINCTLENIASEGWGEIEGSAHHLRFYEYNSRDKAGNLIDVSHRHPRSRQLMWPADSALIETYSSPTRILNWKPTW